MKKITCILLMLLCSNWLYAKEGKQAFGAANTLQFLENSGQITDQHKQPRKDIDFKIEVGGLTIFGGSAALHYQWVQHTGSPMDSNMQTETYRMDVVLLGANKHAKLLKEEPQPYYENYYYTHCKDGATAHSYKRMVYKDIYPNIDWVIYTTGKELKYDFVVHRGGNPANIQLQYSGATALQLKDGAFTATTPMGSITEDAPYSYLPGSKKQVKSAYKLNGDVLSFDVRSRDEELVIDPNIVWVTYYGGSNWEFSGGVVADDSDKVYMSGTTTSTNNIATTGAWKTTLTSVNGVEGFITCITAAGVRQWGTYLGGNNYNYVGNNGGGNLAIDTIRDCLYIAYPTNDSSGIATTGAHQTVYGGGSTDAYLQKFSLTGFRIWATYYGGSGEEYYSSSVEADYMGNVYLYGHTSSNNNIATPGSYRTTPSGGYLAKFNTAGVRQWATYLCVSSYGYGGNWANGDLIKTGRNGDVYIAGVPLSLGCMAGTAGTHRPSPISTSVSSDVWLGKFTPSGSLVWGTYYGGTDYDWPSSISVANNGDVYVGGTTRSDTGITTAGAFRTLKYPVSTPREEGFLARFDGSGRRVWATYIADSLPSNYGYNWRQINVIVSDDSKVYISGDSWVPSLSWPNHELITPNGFQTSRGSVVDVVLGMFDTSGKRLWGSFLGGNGHDGGYVGGGWGNSGGLALTDKYLYLGSATTSTFGLAGGVGAIHQTTAGGSYDAFIAQLSLDTTVRIRMPFSDTLFCPGDTFKIKYKVNFPFRTGNVFSVQLSNASGSFASPTVIGTKTTNTDDSITYVIPRTAPAGNGYRIRVIASAPADTSPDVGVNIRIKPLPANVQASTNAPVCAGDTLRLSASSANTDVTWSWVGIAGFSSSSKDTFRAAPTTAHSGNYIVTANRNGCIVKDTVTVLIKPRPDTPDAFNNGPLCTGDVINLTGSSPTGGVTYQWTGPSGFTSTAQNPVRTGAVTAYGGVYKVYTSLNGCAALFYDSTTVVVHPVTPVPSASANTPVCIGQDLQLMASTLSGASYVWSGPGGFSSLAQNPLLMSSTTAFAGKYYVHAVLNNCPSATDSVSVIVNPSPVVNMYPSPKDSICVGGTVNFVSNISNTGTSFVRTWYKNGNVIGGAANANYSTSAVADMDEFYVSVTVSGVCATPYTVDGNKIKMRVLPWLTPSAAITANPTGTVKSGTVINFTANAVNGGNKPAYQWLRNGTSVTGAISNTWGAATLSNNDQICVDVTSNYLCPSPKTVRSNCIKVSIESTGVANVWSGKEPAIYPNPVKEIVHVEGVEKGTVLKLYDAAGKLVLSEIATDTNIVLNLAGLASGNYILRLSTDTGNNMRVKLVKE